MRCSLSALVAIVLVLISSSARAEESDWFQPPRWHEAVLMGSAELLVAVDILQTLDMNRRGNGIERNPLLGPHPSDARIIALGITGGLGTAALWYSLPHEWRWLVPCLLIGAEAAVIYGNAQAGLRVHF
jgi:hypothetical protein